MAASPMPELETPSSPQVTRASYFHQLERDIVEHCDRLYDVVTTDRERDKEVREMCRAMDFIDGKQWTQGRGFGRNKAVINKTRRTLIENIGLLTDLAISFTVEMYGDKLTDHTDLTKIIKKLVTHWAKSGEVRLEQNMYDLVVYGLLREGVGKFQWNSTLNGGMGDVQMVPVAPWQWGCIGAGTNHWDAECFLYFPVVTREHIARRFGKSLASRVECDMEFGGSLSGGFNRPGHISRDSWSRMGTALQTAMGVKKSALGNDAIYPMVTLKEFWLRDDCIAPSTRVLTTSLEWKRADEIMVGDTLIGCDEETSKAEKNNCRWLREVRVERVKKLVRPSVRITTDKGVIECSKSHRWLATPDRNTRYSWMFSGELKLGDRIAFTFEPWETDTSWGAGYLAGLLDGEGWATKYDIGFGQSNINSEILDLGKDMLAQRGFPFAVSTAKKLWKNAKAPTTTVTLRGGRGEALRLLGSVRPARLLSKAERLWNGKLLKNKGEVSARILAIEDIGNAEVVAIKTDKQTFIADGFVSHNSTNDRSETVTVGPADENGEPKVNWAYRVEPGMPLYPRGRLIVTAGGVVLEDSPNPYWHTKFPFGIFRPFRFPWKLNGDMMMRPWLQMNSIINQLMSGMLDYLKAVNEPTLVAPKGAFPSADWDALDPGAPGGKIKYNNNAPKTPEYMKRMEAPIAANMQYLQMIDREFDMSSGASAMQQALGKKQVPGGDSLEMILNSRSLPIRVESRSLAWYMEDGGSMVVANMLQFYSASHRMSILGTDGLSSSDFRPIYGHALPEGMAGEEFVRRFQGTIKRDTLLQSQKAEQMQLAIALSKMGKISDEYLFKTLDLSNFSYADNVAQMLKEAKLKMMVAAANAQLQGKGKKQGK